MSFIYLGLIRVFVFILLNIERKCALDFFGGTGGAIEEDEDEGFVSVAAFLAIVLIF